MAEKITRGLLIREPWISMILDGKKDWEMRTKATKVRGSVALIAAGTGKIVGIADIVGVEGPMSQAQIAFNQSRHRIPHELIDSGEVAKWNTAWVMKNATRLEKPLSYKHPSGAVIWVNLDDEVQIELEKALKKEARSDKRAPKL